MNTNGLFLQKYIDEMTSVISKMNPDWSETKVRHYVEKYVENHCQNPSVSLHNNYTGQEKSASLLSVLDWVLKSDPIICGNATFYKNQYDAYNPIATMLKGFLDQRKAYKKLMFKVEDSESPKYKDFDRKQLNEKINANSYYGASGAPSSSFYSEFSGPATTYSARSVISTAEQLFEGLLADNYMFLDITECIEWCEKNLKEFYSDNKGIDDFIKHHKRKELHERLFAKIINKEDWDEEILEKYISSLDGDSVDILYYKNNLLEFFYDHKEVSDLILNIFINVHNYEYVDEKDPDWLIQVPLKQRENFKDKDPHDWNKFVNNQYFMDPNDVPDTIKDDIKQLKKYVMKYVYSRYLSPDRIYRLQNFKRRCVTVIDTDSNILSLDTAIDFIMEMILENDSFGRANLNNIFIAVNMLAYISTEAVTDILLTYGKYSNIPEEFRPIYNMKNEFFFLKLVIGMTKKRYISKILLREGNLMNPPKYEIKGFDFKKATTSEYAEEFYLGLLKKHVINSDDIEVREINIAIKNFRDEIRQSIKNGELKFLPNGSAKEPGAYKDPLTNGTVRAVTAWNMLIEDNQIEFPSKVSLLKLNIFKESDIEPLKETNPDMYDKIIDRIFHDTTGYFVTNKSDPGIGLVRVTDKKWKDKIPKKYRTKYGKLGPEAWNNFVRSLGTLSYEDTITNTISDSKGLQTIAIPSNARIPEWLQPYIDYDTMIDTIIAPFNPVLEIFKSRTIDTGKGTRKTASFSNIIKF